MVRVREVEHGEVPAGLGCDRREPRGTEIAAAAGDTLLDAYLELERRLGRPLAGMEAMLEELNVALTAVAEEGTRESG
jgi:hypothetical protein